MADSSQSLTKPNAHQEEDRAGFVQKGKKEGEGATPTQTYIPTCGPEQLPVLDIIKNSGKGTPILNSSPKKNYLKEKDASAASSWHLACNHH